MSAAEPVTAIGILALPQRPGRLRTESVKDRRLHHDRPNPRALPGAFDVGHATTNTAGSHPSRREAACTGATT
jgi:hypothetical protein